MATAISVYYLGQEVGIIAGIGISSAILRMDFRSTLLRKLVDFPEKDQVSEPWQYNPLASPWLLLIEQ